MECNRDEAFRAREIAEKKLKERDIVGAKKFARKAHILYPGLDGIVQMLETINVYISAENKVNGERDWYGVLNVSPMDEHESIRKQYRKLALMFHPDKNKSVGSEGAFKIISEAWSFLSDKSKRSAYDKRRNYKVFQPKSPPPSSSTSVPANGSSNFIHKTNVKPPKNVAKPPCVPTHKPKQQFSNSSAKFQDPKPDTFWTICRACKMQYEYLRVYLNHNLLCPNCRQAFRAFETTPPLAKGVKRTTWNCSKKQQKSFQVETPSPGLNDSRSPISQPGPGSGGQDSRVNMKYSDQELGSFSKASQQASTSAQHLPGRDEGDGEGNIHTSIKEGSVFYESHGEAKRPKYTGEFGSENNERIILIQTDIPKCNGLPSAAARDMPKVLMEKARKHIYKKLDEWKAESSVRWATKEARVEQSYGRESENTPLINTCSNSTHVKMSNMMNVEKARGIDSDGKTLESISIDVPDPEFYDFDKFRSESCFKKNQVWAVYDDVDGMPRNYVLIRDIVSVTPFKVKIRWLNSMINSGFGLLNCIGSGFFNTRGTFRLGRSDFNMSLNSFSHKVKWSKDDCGAVCIHPRKRDVWVLYRNWSAHWNELTPDEVIQKYDVVEVLEDYDEESGVAVTPLVKVSGFKTVFHRHLDPNQIRVISKEDMFQFSHQVPSHALTGREAVTAPKGCRELDPAATPSDLLQVISDNTQEEMVGNDGTVRRRDNIINLEDENEVEMVDISKVDNIKSVNGYKQSSEIGDESTTPCKLNL